MTADDLRDPLWDNLINAIDDLNTAERILENATYGPSNGSRTDTTELQNDVKDARAAAREAVIAWKFPKR